ncbi:hypothetical protein TNCV_714361 [Trichonephila clavipes]|nr:hypothetical protein TNCV_714361 [Trichonephila clavipes]
MEFETAKVQKGFSVGVVSVGAASFPSRDTQKSIAEVMIPARTNRQKLVHHVIFVNPFHTKNSETYQTLMIFGCFGRLLQAAVHSADDRFESCM